MHLIGRMSITLHFLRAVREGGSAVRLMVAEKPQRFRWPRRHCGRRCAGRNRPSPGAGERASCAAVRATAVARHSCGRPRLGEFRATGMRRNFPVIGGGLAERIPDSARSTCPASCPEVFRARRKVIVFREAAEVRSRVAGLLRPGERRPLLALIRKWRS
ncbi:predicted protein [Streptomyces sp. AA4]|nr:predicted protein [Streptomyces sp. AA4]